MIQLRLSAQGLEQVLQSMRRLLPRVQRALDATAVELESRALEGIAPHTDTGALERSLDKQREPAGSGPGWRIAHDLRIAPHALWVHDGTRPHVILPRQKKALRWAVGGGAAGFRFARGVKHPGYAGDPWMQRAAAQAPQIFQARLRAELARPAG